MWRWHDQLTDEQVARIVSIILRLGVLGSSAVVLAGGVLYLARHGSSMPRYEVFHGEPTDLSNVGGIVGCALDLDARGIIQLGILVLIATPVARVVFAALGFALQRDRTYIGVSLIVLAVLLYSLSGGAR